MKALRMQVRGGVRTVGHQVMALLLIGLLLGSSSSSWGETANPTAPRVQVAATIFPLYDLVRNIAGPAVEVLLIVPPGASPHTFALRPGAIRALTGSAAIFAIGHGLDDWVTALAHNAGVPQTIIVDADIPLHRWDPQSEAGGHHQGHAAEHGPLDPHYWLSVPNAIRMSQTIAEALGRLDPAARDAYRQQAAAYQTLLRGLDTEIRQLLADLPQRGMATFHMAFGYFAAAYELQIVATFEPSPGQEPTPRQVERFLTRIRAHRLLVLFVEPQLPRGVLASLARDLGVVLTEIDPLGGSKGRDSYIAMMRFNAVTIAAALRG